MLICVYMHIYIYIYVCICNGGARRVTCLVCSLRLRELLKARTCILCTRDMPQVSCLRHFWRGNFPAMFCGITFPPFWREFSFLG